MSDGLSLGDVRKRELAQFAKNAATLLLERGKLEDFFRHLNYEVERSGQGYRGVCPVCRESYAYIGLRGDTHPIYWQCPKNKCAGLGGFRPNILGLTKAIVPDQHLGTAIKTIANFLGERSFDITNGRPKGVKPDEPDYVILTDTEERRARLQAAGIHAMRFTGCYGDPRLRRPFVIVVMDTSAELVADVIRKKYRNVVVTHPAIHFFAPAPSEKEGELRHHTLVLMQMVATGRIRN